MNKIIEKLRLGSWDIPTCIRVHSNRLFILAGGMFLLGVSIMFFSFSGWMSFVSASIISIILICIGYYRLLKVSNYGYVVRDGICEQVEYTLPSRMGGNFTKDVPKRYLIQSDGITYGVLYNRHNPIIYEGNKVRMYFSPDMHEMEWNGVYTTSSLLGYEVLGRPIDTDSGVENQEKS